MIVTPVDTTICPGEPIILTAQANTSGTYEWSTGETTPVITVNPMSTTTYNVTFSDDTGCGDPTQSVTVQVIPSVTISIDISEVHDM